ncbi:hypothetical protein PXH69_28930 [Rhodococcus qingshengii]|uniref:Uncharacterized protein n=1 Tax=Rhodococcus qingshengii TaxID=334542 RepID=A0AAW6LT12_RHOSG|nr:hypothetical protein [Rhodococcus qingshengii]MDE8649003.1 hypothetical protein [Rhodococcus qingshengii]
MSQNLIMVLHRIPFLPRTTVDGEWDLWEQYRSVIERTAARWIADAMVADRDFDVSDFGIDDDDFHDGAADAVRELEQNPEAIAAARTRLNEIAETYAIGYCGARAEFVISGMWVAMYGGLSWGDEPFEGYGQVCALAALPELAVGATSYVPTALQASVVDSLLNDGSRPSAQTRWIDDNAILVSGWIAAEVDAREAVIGETVRSAVDSVELDVLVAVSEKVAEHCA